MLRGDKAQNVDLIIKLFERLLGRKCTPQEIADAKAWKPKDSSKQHEIKGQEMKKLIGLAMVMFFASSLVWAGELTFKGIPMKTTQAKFQKAFKTFDCNPPKEQTTVCTSSKDTYGELPVDNIEAEFWNGKLISITATRSNPSPEDAISYYSQWKEKLSLKFGTPNMVDKKDLGPSVIVVSMWESKSGTVALYRHPTSGLGSTTELETSVSITSSDYVKINTERWVKKYSVKVKDM